MDSESKSERMDSSASKGNAPGAEGHLDRAVLLDYRAHRLSTEAEVRVQGHLEACETCRELAVEVSAFVDPPEGDESETSPAERAANWARVRQELEREGWFGRRRATLQRRVLRPALLAAACLVLAIVGLPRARMMGAQEQILVSVGAFKGPQDEIAKVRLPVVLRLRLAAAERSAALRADLADGEGREAGSFRRLRPDPEGFVPVPLSRWSFNSGRYRLTVRPEGPEAEDRVDEYEFDVVTR